MSYIAINALGDTAPSGTILPGAKLIIGAVSRNMRSGLRLTGIEAVMMANVQIDPKQRFYRVELVQASETLGRDFGVETYYGSGPGAWLEFLERVFGSRVVPIVACPPGYKMSPITKTCAMSMPSTTEPPVKHIPFAPPVEPEIPHVPPAVEPEIPYVPIQETGAGTGFPLPLLVVGAIGAVLLLRR